MLSDNPVAESVHETYSGWRAVTASVRGSSHLRTGLPNQDACDYTVHGEGGDASVILAVADGHGGGRHFRSQTGSALAVQVALTVLRSAASRANFLAIDHASHLEYAQQISEAWRSAVLADLEGNPFTDEELTALSQLPGGNAEMAQDDPEIAYGSTLLAAVATDSYVWLLQIGDGDILAVRADGETTRPIASDDRLVGNQTTSLCQPDAWTQFRSSIIHHGNDFPALLLLSTDGYANSFRSEADFLKIGKDYLSLIRERGLDSVAEELPTILADASKSGSADDVTLGIIYNGNAVSAGAALLPEAAQDSVKKRRPTISHRIIPLFFLVGIGLIAFALFHYRGKMRNIKPKKQPDIVTTGTTEKNPTPHPVKKTIKAGNSPSEPKLPNWPPKGKEWALKLGGDRLIPLRPGTQVTSGLLFSKDEAKSNDLYASVRDKNSILYLVNESADTWTVILPGNRERKPVEPGGTIELASNVRLILHSHSAKLVLRNAPSPKGAPSL